MARRFQQGLVDDLPDNNDINVVPFIDIMLVLLIIFMVAAPLATVDVNVDLPSSNSERVDRPDEPLYLTLKPDLTLALGEAPVAREHLGELLHQTTGGDLETRIFLRADKNVDYGEFMELMNLVRAAGYLKIALVSLEAGAVDAAEVSDADESASAQPSR